MKPFRPIFILFAMTAPLSAGAVSIDISYPDQDSLHAALSAIDQVEDRVYTLRLDEDGTGSILFGDGIEGARPSSEGPAVGSYRYGSGSSGNIVNEYPVTGNKLPFIPITDFWPSGVQQPEASFILAGLETIEFDFSLQGMQVTGAEPLAAVVPVPVTAWLFGTSLIGLIGFCRRIRTNRSGF